MWLGPRQAAVQGEGVLHIGPPLEAVGCLVGAGGGAVAVVGVPLVAAIGRNVEAVDAPVAQVGDLGQEGAQQHNEGYYPYEAPLPGRVHRDSSIQPPCQIVLAGAGQAFYSRGDWL